MSTATYDTLERLARLPAGRFQRLGDELLPQLDARLIGLKPSGINADDRTLPGVPDSFVGPSAYDCLVAVEYTTQRTGIAGKFRGDFAAVVTRCPRAALVVLVAASPIDDLDLEEVRTDAITAGREVVLLGGERLAGMLDLERQDLRREYLNIPIVTHTLQSVSATLATHTRRAIAQGRVRQMDLDLPIPRDALQREVAQRTAALGGVTYVHAPIGTGKSTWSYGLALGRGHLQPTIWLHATDLAWQAGIDPIASYLAYVAYGAPSPDRVLELGDLLGRAGAVLLLVLDGIDEVEDYDRLARAVREFSAGALGARTHVIATCRSEALPMLVDVLPTRDPRLGGPIAMRVPDERELTSWLERSGTPAGRARQVMASLPPDLRRPLFLRLALELPPGDSDSEAALGARVVGHLAENLARSLRIQGIGPSAADVRDCLGSLAWACMAEASDAVEVSTARGGSDLWRESGERSLLGRATSNGIVTTRSGERLSFTHAFFQHAFAAAVAPRNADEWVKFIEELRPESLRGRLGALTEHLPNPEPLLECLLEREPLLALWCASRASSALSDRITGRLLPHVGQLLRSRFTSDRKAGLKLLSLLRGAQARAYLASWVQGLDRTKLRIWAPYIGKAMWEQRHPEPFGILLMHPRLLVPSDFPWIEPAFAEEVNALPGWFREDLRTRALRVAEGNPELGSAARSGALLLLALLRDEQLVRILRAKLSIEGRLGPVDHRVLLFLDTEEAIMLYAESAEAYLEEIRGVPREDDRDGRRRSTLMSSVVLKHLDIAMFPHQRLLDLVEGALMTSDRLLAWFGHEWLDIVLAPQLIPAACRGVHTLRGSIFVGRRLPDERLASRADLPSLFDVYRRGGRDVRRFVVDQLAAHHEEASVMFLCDRLTDPDLAARAARSLGQLGSSAAVPYLTAALDAADPADAYELARALGVIAHVSAVPALGRALQRCITAREASGANARRDWAERQILVSLASLGGSALDILRDLWGNIDHRGVVKALVARGGEAEIALVVTAVDAEPSLVDDIIKNMGAYRLEAHLPHYFRWPRPFIPHLHDERLLQRLLDSVSSPPTPEQVEAVARFAAPRALAFVRSVAADPALPLEHPSAHQRTARATAVDILVELGELEYLRPAVAEAVDRVLARDAHYPMDLQDCPRWLVRERALELVSSAPNPKRVRLLRWFAQPEDRPIFEDLERSSDTSVADEAHSFLTWSGFLFHES